VPGGPPETAELGRALNALADRIHELVAAEREHVADLGHRLRTPVTALRLDTDLVEDDEVARRLRGHVEDLQRSIDDVVHEARRSVRDELPGNTEIAPVVADRVAFWLPLAEDQGRRLDLVLEVRTPGGSPLVGLADDDLGELVDTLLDNVFAHTPDGTDARVTVRTRADEVVVVVEDAGPGMPQPYLGRGHSAGGSTGLGLAIVHRIADGAGGSVQLAPSTLGGLCVTVHLPVHRDGVGTHAGADTDH
jgi:signal transduction histidine kinase